MLIRNSERLLRLNLQFFGGEGDGGTAATGDNTATENNTAAETGDDKAKDTVLSSEAIQKMIQSTVDNRTAELGKTIASLKKENEQLKKANMTAEQIAQAEREEFETQKAEVEFQKREIYAHKVVAKAGYSGDDAQSVVDIVLSKTDEETADKLQKFTAIVDKVASQKVDKLYSTNGRDPKASHSNTDGNKTINIAEKLGKQTAEADKQAQDVLQHYLGGNK